MKKLISLTLAAAMTMSLLAGCGSNSSAGTDSADASAETFKIGGIGPITGAGAVYGIAVKNGAELAIKEINEAGGINGYQIEYNFQDDELDNEKSVNAYNTLKDWGMNMLVGSVTSGCCVAVAAESKNDNMFQITPSGSSVDCIEGNDNVFQVCFTDPNQGVGAADYIGENNLASKVAVIYDSSDVYSSGIYAKFKEEAATQNFEIVSEEAFTADNKTDFSVQLAKAQEAGAELVFLPIYYTEASLILKQADSMGYAPKFFGCDGLDGILGVENFDTSLAEGVMLLTPFTADAEDEKTQNFVKKYTEKYGETPNQFAADAYDCVYAIYEACQKGGITADMSTDEMCAKLIEIFTSSDFSFSGLTGEVMTWSDTGEVSKDPKGMVIKNGAYVGM